MNTNTTTKPADTTTKPADTNAESKPKTVIDDMAQRRMFNTTEEAESYIAKCKEEYADFSGYPVAVAGLTEEGDFDPEVYTDQMRVGVYVLTKRGEGPNTTSVHCIVIAPAPKVAALLGLTDEDTALFTHSAGVEWLTGIIDKEINHVTVRQLRKAENAQEIAEAVESMPTSLAAFITSGRESTSGIIETFNQLWQIIKKGIGAKSKPFALANLSKKELRKAMESASYAATVYPQLETRTNKKGEPESLFALAATFGQLLARQDSLDPTIFDRMLSQRDEKEIAVSDDDEAEFDVEAMAASLAKKDDPSEQIEQEADAEGEEEEAPDAE
jgi:hypothetical protein